MTNSMSAIIKFINGKNDKRDYLSGAIDYVTDATKTNGGALVATQGCSRSHILDDILVNKVLHHKPHGKQGVHFVLAFPPEGNAKSSTDILNVTREIVSTVYPDYLAIMAVHIDSRVLHSHVILDAVNAVTGKKLSQGPGDLNRVKQKVNGILKANGFEIIRMSTNEFVDYTNHGREEGFDFLELDETKLLQNAELISESDITEIIPPSDLLTADEFAEVSRRLHNYRVNPFRAFGGRNSMQILRKNEIRTPAQDVQITPATSAPLYAAENVSTATGTTNPFPTTTLATGPVFHIRGELNSELSGLSEVALQTVAYTQKQRVEDANLAMAMQTKAQASGLQTNVTVFSGSVFEIEMCAQKSLADIVSDESAP